jgi:hypothetical protein
MKKSTENTLENLFYIYAFIVVIVGFAFREEIVHGSQITQNIMINAWIGMFIFPFVWGFIKRKIV